MNSTFASSYELLLSAISELELQKDSFVLHPGVDFSRKRKISFRDTILSLLTMQGGSLSTTSHDFFQHRFPADIPSLSAIHQQRAKLLPDAMSYLFYHFTQKAQKEKPGVLKTQQEEVWKKELKRAKKNSDYVIAYVHWGTEGKIHYGQDQTEIADLCVKAGADAVIGGHPHRLQGVEFIKNVPVAYSVGNFWFSTGKLYTTIAQIQIDDSGSLKLRMIPCIQDSLTPSILTEKKQIKAFYHYLADISNHVGIDEDGFFYPYKNVEKPGVSPYAYTSGKRYGQYFDDVDLDLKSIDIVGNLQ